MKTYLFFRGSGFYPIELRDDQSAIQNALLNPGTIRVEDALTQKTIWPADAPDPELSSRNPIPSSAALTPGDAGGVGQELVECRECLAMAFEALAQAGRRFGYIASGCSPDVANPTVGAHEAMDVFRMIDVRMSKYPAFSKAWIATPPAALPPPSPDAKLGEDAREVIAALNGYKEVCTQAQRFEEAVIYSKAVKLITAPTRPAAPSATERNV